MSGHLQNTVYVHNFSGNFVIFFIFAYLQLLRHHPVVSYSINLVIFTYTLVVYGYHLLDYKLFNLF